MKETITRSLTGIALIALIVVSLVLHSISFLFVFGIACLLSWLEFVRMFRNSIPPLMQTVIAVFLCGSFYLVYFIASGEIAGKWFITLPVLLLLLPLLLRLTGPSTDFKRIVLISLATGYMLAGFSSLHCLAFTKTGTYSPEWILFTFYFLWMYDTMAYVSGRLAGKHTVWPSVSPGKTWEGSIGGAVFTIVLAIIFSRFFPALSTGEWIAYAGIVIVFGSFGDFFESWLKRKAGVKDSGRILPGHGGVLDRLDSLLLSVPFVTLYLYFIL